ncbi:MAG: methyltransferase domain-containing protein [Methanothrix sp.]|nr:methyltransferase domain-containing protein [Methanothrix sp.]
MLFEELEKINTRPEPFEFYTADDLWADEYTSEQMLSFHLNPEIDVSSRKAAFIDRSVEWITAYFRVGKGTKIADFGCGPGLYTTKLARRQAEVTGIDFSKRSIQYAQEAATQEGLSIQYINQNYLDFKTNNRFHLILMIMCDFCALSPTQRKRMLTKFHTLLQPGGCVLLDVYSMNAFLQREETAMYEANMLNCFWSPNKYYGFLNTFKYKKESMVLDKYSLFEADRTRTVYNWLQYFSPDDLKKELAGCKFAVEEIFSDVAGSAYDPQANEFAVIAKKL